MCKKIISVVLFVALVLTTLTFSSCGEIESKNPTRPDYIPMAGDTESDLDSEEYRVIAENSNLQLLFNDGTTDIKVINKKTGFEWSSEYYDSEYDEYYRGQIFNIQYTDKSGTEDTKYSDADSVELGQFKVEEVENGIKVQYGVGDVGYAIRFPMALSPERYEELAAKMDEEQAATFATYYGLYDFTDEEFIDGWDTEDLEMLKNSYKNANDGPWYYMGGGTKYEVVNEVNALFDAIGYTEEEMESDNDEGNISARELDVIEFSVSIIYTLTDTSLSVTIPESEIYYNEDYPIEAIQVIPNFMDFDNTYDGYFMLPDGSGSVMNFNNNKESLRDKSVYVQMYGVDTSRVVNEKTAYYNDAVMPVFGTCVYGKNTGKKGGNYKTNAYNGVFGVIEAGETFAGIEACNYDYDAGKHNNMFLEFRINERVRMDAFSYSEDDQSKYCKYQFQRYLGDIKFSLHFLDGANATYSGMANYYSGLLFKEDAATAPSDYYSTVEAIGEINTTDKFFGIEYNTKKVLSSFSQIGKIANDLQASGFKNMNVKVSGWCNGGYENGWLDEGIDISKDMGGDDGLTALAKDLESKNIGLYPDVDFQNYYVSEGVPGSKNIASSLNGTSSMVTTYSPVDFLQTSKLAKFVLTMNSTIDNFNGFMDEYKGYDIKSVSYRGIGNEINSNFKDDESFMERQETLENLVKLVSSSKDNGYSVMANGGQIAYLDYVDIMNNVPLESDKFDKCDYSIPFVGMVLSGHIDYTSSAINLSSNTRMDLLRLIESGAGAYYTLTSEYYEELGNTSYDDFYSTVYSDIKDNIMESYSYLSEAMNGVYGLKIVSHERLDENVFKTTYSNGTSIYINYTDNVYTDGSVKVAAQDYLKVEGDAK